MVFWNLRPARFISTGFRSITVSKHKHQRVQSDLLYGHGAGERRLVAFGR